ncbi:capsule synthesis positive regulator AcpB (plasmid) [Bacillus thuringiensis serovar morrisoni str. 4AA1]|uniref:BglG family transcription antiterminator n=2 Tax=Bacillus TaxID=1386 RepID=UPI001592F6BB|nr:helix-turn-helix domain-containing protein [Bacillus thuringiensis]MED3102195.1 helix-turn-helix domain-containing protein [Bacillus thuringiensis]UEL01008.1 helix-turn-helix domain-containing protein [Bacillus thuringiensis]UOC04674.1 capsule synthesis positive regulator AcpB [Bacillus thuringiensis serovar morrisoni str. 4AA1]WMR10208.1 helix-turn-helix domain-containing protein [Bacillus thuringiensis serovar tenebrionis]WMR15936.1 helix-turn-helix domain-containing protein [Bacillus thu
MCNYNLITTNKFAVKIQSDLQRKIKLLELISNESRWYTFEEISECINFSTKTISKDLVIIKDVIPENWDIKIKRGFGVQLSMPPSASIKEITFIFFRNSYTFQVLNVFLSQGEITITNLAKALHIQPYVINKILKKVEKDINQYDLRLQRKPLTINGEEWNIINMFTIFYTKAYLISKWPFHINQSEVLLLIEMLEDSSGLTLNLGSRRFLSFYIAILLIRKQQGIKFEKIDRIFYLNIDTPHFSKMNKQINEWSKKYGISFSDSEKILISITFKCQDYLYEQPINQKNIDIKIFKEKKIEIYNMIRNFIEMLYKRLGYQFIKDEEFIHSLIIHFRKRIYQLHCYPYIKHMEVPSIEYMQKKYFKTFLQVKDVYNNWIKLYNIANYVPDEEIISIVIYIEAALICKNIKPKKVFIVTKEDECWKKYIKAILKERFGNKIDFPIIVSSNIEKGLELEPKYEVDFIISTIPLTLKSHPVIQIQPTISKRDLYNLECYIN